MSIAQPAESVMPKRRGRLVLRPNLNLTLGGILLALIIAAALAAPLIAPYDPYVQNLDARLVPPVWHDAGSWAHPLGTDHLGRDYLSRIIHGGRISLLIGFSAAMISGLIGTLLGLLAGYFGGRVDLVITFLITVRLCMPLVVVALAVVALVGNSLTLVIAVLGLLMWDRFAVVVRAATLQVRHQDYVSVARAMGSSTSRIVFTEVLPNILPQIIVVATLEMAHAILVEAALSFLGLGVQPPAPSWGLMISEGRNSILFDSWLITIPGVALLVLTLAISLLGDGLRDATAPAGRSG
jgi:peptide/nickel transport system permease protein